MTANRTLTAPVTGPVVFDLEAGVGSVVVTVSPDAEVASAELSGPAEVVDNARPDGSDGRWSLVLPRSGATVAGVSGTVIQSAGSTVIVGNVVGAVHLGHGQVTVNGIEVTGATVMAPSEPVRLAVTLPADSRLDARVGAGTLTTHGYLPSVDVSGTSPDIDIDGAGVLRARTVSGDIRAAHVSVTADLHVTSGDIGIRNTAGNVTAQSVSGDIGIRSAADITIDARSVSGDITVRSARGTYPDVRARSVSGDVRTTAERN